MKNLPVVSGKNLIKALKKYGFWVERQKGAHVRLKYKSKKKQTLSHYSPLSSCDRWQRLWIIKQLN